MSGVMKPGRGKFGKISDAEYRACLARINDRPRSRAAEEAGVSLSTFYRVVRECGGDRYRLTAEEKERRRKIISEMYPHYSKLEIQRMTGIPASAVTRYVKRTGAEHTDACKERLKKKALDQLAANRKKVDRKKQAVKRRVLYRMEYYRLWEGKPQLTCLRLARMPHRVYAAAWALCKRYGYDWDKQSFTLEITPGTRRNGKEEYFTKKYGLKFVGADVAGKN